MMSSQGVFGQFVVVEVTECVERGGRGIRHTLNFQSLKVQSVPLS